MVCMYLDDILVSGKTQQEHLANLNEVLTRLESAGLRLKKEKCTFCKPEVPDLGHIISASGLKPSPAKAIAVFKIPSPSKVSELKTFLGLVNYYAKFLPDLATRLAPLYKLLKHEEPWNGPQSKRKHSKMLRNHCCLLKPFPIFKIPSQLSLLVMLLFLESGLFCHRYSVMD